jgi:hypothetical protein
MAYYYKGKKYRSKQMLRDAQIASFYTKTIIVCIIIYLLSV